MPTDQQLQAVVVTDVDRRLGGRAVLQDLHLSIAANTTVLIAGRNGAGKSTLLRLLAMLLQPHRGTITLFGKNSQTAQRDLRKQVGFLSHKTCLYHELSVRENILLRAHLFELAAPKQATDQVIEKLQLTPFAKRPVAELSQGMQQRAALAANLVHNPMLLLLDEPFANLDPASKREVTTAIRHNERTIVMTSHDVERDLELADSVIGLQNGSVHFATPAANFDSTELVNLYL